MEDQGDRVGWEGRAVGRRQREVEPAGLQAEPRAEVDELGPLLRGRRAGDDEADPQAIGVAVPVAVEERAGVRIEREEALGIDGELGVGH